MPNACVVPNACPSCHVPYEAPLIIIGDFYGRWTVRCMLCKTWTQVDLEATLRASEGAAG